MPKLRFCLIGDGAIAKYHKKAIEHVGGGLIAICDPEKYSPGLIVSGDAPAITLSNIDIYTDFFIICSPSNFHRDQIQFLLLNASANSQVICEKPAFMPWEPMIDDSRINIVLQLRYLPGLPEKVDLVKAVFVRDEEYFKTWKGDARKTGGLFFNLFIHYIDLAIQLGAEFEGMVWSKGKQEKKILSGYKSEKLEMIGNPEDPRIEELEAQKISYQTPIGANRYDKKTDSYTMDLYNESEKYKNYGTWDFCLDLLKVDMQACYNNLYEDIISGGGIKPKDLFYLNWILQRNSEIFGYGRNSMNKLIKIGKELL